MRLVLCSHLLLMSALISTLSVMEAADGAGGGDSRSGGRQPSETEPVIIVGGGLAGLVAALEAVRNGAFVVIIDGEKDVGGNSAKASSGISGSGTKAQRRLGIEDSADRFYADTMAAGDRENDPALVDVLVHDSASAVEFLMTQGVDLSDVNLCGGHSVPRVHWIPSPKEGKPTPVGFGIIKALKAKLAELAEVLPGVITFRFETEVVGLVTWNEYITGVRVRASGDPKAKTEEITGKAVILATGGFSNDRDNETSLLAEFASDKMHFPTTNGPFARGTGLKMARAMGAALVGMSDVQIHPTAFIDPKNPVDRTKFLAAEALRGKGAILINGKGERFGNELGRRDYLTGRILSQCAANPQAGGARTAIMLMTDATADAFGRPAFNFYANVKGFFKKFDDAAALATHFELDAEKFSKTLEEYNQLVVESAKEGAHTTDRFEKTVFPAQFDPKQAIYAALVTPAIHYTMGGLKIDKQARVFNEFTASPFKGLFAAGEVTGGVHGKNRIAGNSLLECVVFGRIAGRNAAAVSYANEPVNYTRQTHGEL